MNIAASARRTLIIALLGSLLSAGSAGADWDLSAQLDFQSRFFTDNVRWKGQDSRDVQFAITASADIRWRDRNSGQRVSVIPYARFDAVDDERSLLDLREAYWARSVDSVEILVGANVVFWGVTESVHLVDVVNQSDMVSDIDGEDKLGQPMVNLAIQKNWGLLSVYVLPFFRERTFAGADGRLRSPLSVDTNNARYTSADGRHHVDYAFRYSNFFGDFDVGVSWFKGTSREPRLLPDENAEMLVPWYDQIRQLGVDLQYTGDAWLWKLETLLRDGYASTYLAAVGGFEFTRYRIAGSAADLGFLMEYQFDDRGPLEPVTIADNDVFMGTRLALNDAQDSSLLAGVAYDADTGETIVSIEAERRLGEDFLLELRARSFSGADPENATWALARDHYLEIQVSRYF